MDALIEAWGGRPPAPRSNRVRSVRKILKLTQEEFAKELGISTYTLAKMEQQGREPGTQAGKAAFETAWKRSGLGDDANAT